MTDPATPPAPTPEPVAMTTDSGSYADDDLVYVDPDKNTVVGRVQWSKNGNPKPLPMATVEREEKTEKPAKGDKGGRPKRAPKKRYFPWGTYRSMKRVFKIEGKPPKYDPTHTLEEVMQKALEQPFW